MTSRLNNGFLVSVVLCISILHCAAEENRKLHFERVIGSDGTHKTVDALNIPSGSKITYVYLRKDYKGDNLVSMESRCEQLSEADCANLLRDKQNIVNQSSIVIENDAKDGFAITRREIEFMNLELSFDSIEWIAGYKNDLSLIDDAFTKAISKILIFGEKPVSLRENDSYYRIVTRNEHGDKVVVLFGFLTGGI
jgi:hypothetical protein